MRRPVAQRKRIRPEEIKQGGGLVKQWSPLKLTPYLMRGKGDE